VGAQIEGFDLMVQLTEDAPTIIMEGDEYLSSPLERRSKFLFYDPHIALISGVEWDHFNVFPTYESYVKSFEELADGLPKAGSLIYDETDDIEKIIAAKQREDVNIIPYNAHPHVIRTGKAYLLDNEQEIPLQVFGLHNMKNLMGAKQVLGKMGITDAMFYEAIQSFRGASKRLETLEQNDNTLILRDFAHAPSKVRATVEATKSLYPDRTLVACYELHTFSSLNKESLPQYEGAMDNADLATIFYSPHTLEMKKMPPISPEEIKAAFKNDSLEIFTEKAELEKFLKAQNWYQSNLLLMTSGTFGGMNFNEFGSEIASLKIEKVEREVEPIVKKKRSWKLFGKR
jgi:UDP-N-acetylmuramate: L-alanyl-gamma-D-glutamyl-meso-diaminopimelate ligase